VKETGQFGFVERCVATQELIELMGPLRAARRSG
jgi:hypothetical protein